MDYLEESSYNFNFKKLLPIKLKIYRNLIYQFLILNNNYKASEYNTNNFIYNNFKFIITNYNLEFSSEKNLLEDNLNIIQIACKYKYNKSLLYLLLNYSKEKFILKNFPNLLQTCLNSQNYDYLEILFQFDPFLDSKFFNDIVSLNVNFSSLLLLINKKNELKDIINEYQENGLTFFHLFIKTQIYSITDLKKLFDLIYFANLGANLNLKTIEEEKKLDIFSLLLTNKRSISIEFKEKAIHSILLLKNSLGIDLNSIDSNGTIFHKLLLPNSSLMKTDEKNILFLFQLLISNINNKSFLLNYQSKKKILNIFYFIFIVMGFGN